MCGYVDSCCTAARTELHRSCSSLVQGLSTPTLGHISARVAWSCMPALASTSFWAMPCIFLLAACSRATNHVHSCMATAVCSACGYGRMLLSPARLHHDGAHSSARLQPAPGSSTSAGFTGDKLLQRAHCSLLEVQVLGEQVRQLVEGVHGGKAAQVLHHLHRLQGPCALALRTLPTRLNTVRLPTRLGLDQPVNKGFS